MPFVLLSKPVGASGPWGPTEARAKPKTAAPMKNLMDSSSSIGTGNWAKVVNTTLSGRSKHQRGKGLLKSASPLRTSKSRFSFGLRTPISGIGPLLECGFLRVPKSPLSESPQLVETGRGEIGGPGIPKTDVFDVADIQPIRERKARPGTS